MTDQRGNATSEHDLDWLAFCYVAGELSPAERRRFENRLAEDQLAREAVARAVELGQAAAVAFAAEPFTVGHARTARAAWFLRAAWMGVGAAACLAVVLLFDLSWNVGGAGRDGGPPSVASNGGGSADAGDSHEDQQLALLWIEAREQLAARQAEWSRDTEPYLPPTGDEASGVGPPGAQMDEAGDPLAAPSWLLAALEENMMNDEMPADRPARFEEQ
jgi:hypothetical protein